MLMWFSRYYTRVLSLSPLPKLADVNLTPNATWISALYQIHCGWWFAISRNVGLNFNSFCFYSINKGGGETGSMYVLSYQVRWYLHIQTVLMPGTVLAVVKLSPVIRRVRSDCYQWCFKNFHVWSLFQKFISKGIYFYFALKHFANS